MRLKIEYKSGQEHIIWPVRVKYSNFPKDHIIAVLSSGKEDYFYLEDINRFDITDEEFIKPTSKELEGNVGGLTWDKYQDAFFKD